MFTITYIARATPVQKVSEVAYLSSYTEARAKLGDLFYEYEIANECVGELRMIPDHGLTMKLAYAIGNVWVLRDLATNKVIGFWRVRPRYFK